MPIYEYVCNACGEEFETLHSISIKAPKVACPVCGSKRTKRLVSQSAFHLKGSGWYVTDYASKKTGSQPPKKSEESKKSEPKKSDTSKE